MCLRLSRQDLFNEQTYDASTEFEDVFNLLLEAREFCAEEGCTKSIEKDLSKNLQNRISNVYDRLQMLPRLETYSRHVIGVQEDWVAYICRWEKGVTSCVHGHPWFAYYQVIDGMLNMDLYERCESGNNGKGLSDTVASNAADSKPALDWVKYVQTKTMQPGDVVWRAGQPHQYDNMIHRVSTGDQPGFTLHLFSENPALGEHYQVRAA